MKPGIYYNLQTLEMIEVLGISKVRPDDSYDILQFVGSTDDWYSSEEAYLSIDAEEFWTYLGAL